MIIPSGAAATVTGRVDFVRANAPVALLQFRQPVLTFRTSHYPAKRLVTRRVPDTLLSINIIFGLTFLILNAFYSYYNKFKTVGTRVLR